MRQECLKGARGGITLLGEMGRPAAGSFTVQDGIALLEDEGLPGERNRPFLKIVPVAITPLEDGMIPLKTTQWGQYGGYSDGVPVATMHLEVMP
jgi:hypothetical protein